MEDSSARVDEVLEEERQGPVQVHLNYDTFGVLVVIASLA